MEIKPGQYNTLRVVKKVDFGIYLDGGEMGEILMPAKWVPDGTAPDDLLEVFIYFDSEDRPIATTLKPKAVVGEFTFLEVMDVTNIGAFLDWGLDKDVLVPFKEQKAKMEQGKKYLVYLYLDPRTKRIVASARIEKYLDVEPADYVQGQEVNLIIWIRSEMGYKAIVDQKHLGLLYKNEIFSEIHTGEKLKGYISQVRPDGKIDLSLQKQGFENQVDELSERILRLLKEEEGFLPVMDKTPPEQIYQMFNMSKKNFKKALGNLMKRKIISIGENGISLLQSG